MRITEKKDILKSQIVIQDHAYGMRLKSYLCSYQFIVFVFRKNSEGFIVIIIVIQCYVA
jgi:hypothetical protein